MDKQNLSKYKYIYRIYEDRTGEVHCTKHPVIYINSKVVYFKDARKQEYLSYISVDGVSDDFASYTNEVLSKPYYRSVNHYFWSVEDDITELFQEFKKQRVLAQIIQKEKQITVRYVQAQKEFEAAKAELTKLVLAKENNI
jgi:hypothetical protein